MKYEVTRRAVLGGLLIVGLLGSSSAALADPVYLECMTADAKGKKTKTMAFSLDEGAQTVSGALGAMDGSFAGPSPDADRNLSAVSAALGGESPKPNGANLRAAQTRKASFTEDRVEFSLLQPSGGDAMSVSITISRIDLTIMEKYPLMKARTGTCKLVEPAKRAF